jgi:hypothetical protein
MDFGWEVPGWFEGGSHKGLVWLAPLGVGICREPTPPDLYGKKYWEEYRRRDDSDMGRDLTRARIAFVRRFYNGPVVDVGIGGGRFMEAIGGRGYDINDWALEYLARRDLFANVTQQHFEAMTFWDSLEHMIEWSHILHNCRSWAFVSTPIYLGMEHCLQSKHYKPGEHVIYFTNAGLCWYMGVHGFELAGYDNFETKLGRDSIMSYAFRRAASDRGSDLVDAAAYAFRKRGPE